MPLNVYHAQQDITVLTGTPNNSVLGATIVQQAQVWIGKRVHAVPTATPLDYKQRMSVRHVMQGNIVMGNILLLLQVDSLFYLPFTPHKCH